MTCFFNCACTVRGRMLEINPQQANAYDGDVILRKSLLANDLRKRRKKLQNSTRERRPYLTLSTPHIAGVTLRRKKPYGNDVKKKCAGLTYVCGFAYLANLHTRRGNRRKRHLAASVNMHLRSDGVLRRTPVGSSPASGVSCFVDTKQRYAGAN